MEENLKSGLEILVEILERMELLEQKIDIIDQHVKSISNYIKSSSSDKAVIITPEKSIKRQVTIEAVNKPSESEKAFHNFIFKSTDATKMNNNAPLIKNNRTMENTIVVTGKLVTKTEDKSVLLSGVDVTIFDDKDVLVKKTRTNRAGHWTSHLAPGKYVALFEGTIGGKKLIPINRNFIVPEKLPDGQTEFVVI